MTPRIDTLEAFNKVIDEKEAVIIYFSNNICGACDVLEEKLIALIESDYPKMEMFVVFTETSQEISGQNRVFAAPTILIFFTGREQARFTRSVGISQIIGVIDRPYNMIFDDSATEDLIEYD